MTTQTIEHDLTPDTHSSVVGGSSASRIINCPGSVALYSKLPKAITDESSTYADEGTALHEVMAYLVGNDIQAGMGGLITDAQVDALFEKYSIDPDRMFDAVIPAYRMFNELCDELLDEGGPDDELMVRVENRVEIPGIEGAFGTTDIIIHGPKRTVIFDWKFGAGVPVFASYRVLDPQGNVTDTRTGEVFFETGNEQLLFYGRGSLETHPEYFGEGEHWPVELVICQPRTSDTLSRFPTDVQALEDFRLDLVDAIAETTQPDAHKEIGSWCRFAKCKSICPLHIGAAPAATSLGAKLRALNLEASALPNPEAAREQAIVTVEEGTGISYAEALGAMLDLKEIAEPYFKEAAAQAQTFMEAGGAIPGRKLVPKKAGWDKWKEDRKPVDAFLARQGVDIDLRREPWSPITPAAARTLLKSMGKDEKALKLLEKYVSPGVSSGVTIAPSDDDRPAVESGPAAVKTLAAKIASVAG